MIFKDKHTFILVKMKAAFATLLKLVKDSIH